MKTEYKEQFIRESLEAFENCIQDGLIETPEKFTILNSADILLNTMELNNVSKKQINIFINAIFPIILKEIQNYIFA